MQESIFGRYLLPKEPAIGDRVRIADAAGYTIPKMAWFNGLQLPAIVVRRLDGSLEVVREFRYSDFKNDVS